MKKDLEVKQDKPGLICPVCGVEKNGRIAIHALGAHLFFEHFLSISEAWNIARKVEQDGN